MRTLLIGIVSAVILIALLLLGIAFFSGCCTTKEVGKIVIRDTVMILQPPEIQTVLPADWQDSILVAIQTHGRDTVIDIRYVPKERRVYLKATPDSMRVVFHDTTTNIQYQTTIQNYPLLSKLGWLAIGVGVCVLGWLFIPLIKKLLP